MAARTSAVILRRCLEMGFWVLELGGAGGGGGGYRPLLQYVKPVFSLHLTSISSGRHRPLQIPLPAPLDDAVPMPALTGRAKLLPWQVGEVLSSAVRPW